MKINQERLRSECLKLRFADRHFWNRKCREKTWWQQEFAVFKCEATANSVTGHVCVYNNESVTVYETLDGKGLKNGTPHSRYFSDELGVPIILIKCRTCVDEPLGCVSENGISVRNGLDV